MAKIKLQIPDKDAPGYLQRIRRILVFQEAIEDNALSSIAVDGLIEFLADFVIEPSDREEVKNRLWDATESEFLTMLNGLGGIKDERPLAGQSG